MNALPNMTVQCFYGTSSSNFPLFGSLLGLGRSVVRAPASTTNVASAASMPIPVLPALVGSKRSVEWQFSDPLDPASSGRGLPAGLDVEFCN